MGWLTAAKTFIKGVSWTSKLSGLFSLWGVFKVVMFAAPLVYAYVTKAQHSSAASDLKVAELKNSQLSDALSVAHSQLESERDAAMMLEDSLVSLAQSRQAVVDDRNQAWIEIDALEREKQQFMQRNDLTTEELEYVKCQSVRVPDSRLND